MTDGDLKGARARFGFTIQNNSCPSTMERLKPLAELRAHALLLVGIILAVVGVVNEAYVNELTN
jgi:hypothetical protein